MLNPLKAIRGVRSLIRLTQDPTRLDEVFALAELTQRSGRQERVVAELRADPVFGPVLLARPRLGKVDLAALGRLPAGTLGRAYADFMNDRGLAHEDLELIEGESDWAFVRNHMRETHDLWHVVTGFDTDVAGEIGVQAFYLAQFEAPLAALLIAIGMLNTLLKGMNDRDARMRALARGWILGRRARPMFGVRWADHWESPLTEIRERFRLDLDRVERELPPLLDRARAGRAVVATADTVVA